jgi:hypothetical protein
VVLIGRAVGAVVATVLWTYFSSIAILVGNELNAELSRLRALGAWAEPMPPSPRPTGMRPPSPTRLLPLLAVLLAAGLAGGCSASGDRPSAEPATSSGPGVTTPGPPTAPVAPATQPDDAQATAVRVIATGQVRTGGGPGCLLLAGERGRSWLLVGGDRAALAAGARVRVVGRPMAAQTQTGGCLQGEPLQVVSVSPAG